MKSNSFFPLILAAFLAACTVNVNQPNANAGTGPTPSSATPVSPAPAAPNARWSVVVCSSRAKSVALSAGASETDGELFADWKADSPQRVFALPARLQNLPRVYFKASAADRNQVEMCLLYDGKAKKRVEFDDDEDTFVAATDTDEMDKCRCTQ